MRNHFKKLIYLIVFYASLSNAGSYDDFFDAIRQDNPGPINALLQRGFDPNALSPAGVHGLFAALQQDSDNAAGALINWPKTQVEWRSPKDESPLMLAALKGHTELVRKLIARGADVNKPGWTPLHYAATHARVEIMALLIEHHAYLDAESPNKTTPLMMAAHYGTAAAVKLLLEAGADASLRNEVGMSAIDFSFRAGRNDSADLIAASVRGKSNKGKW